MSEPSSPAEEAHHERSGSRRARRAAPWWVWALVHAAVLGTAVWAVLVLQAGPERPVVVTSSPTAPVVTGGTTGAREDALRTGVVVGLLFGAVTGPLTARHQRAVAAHAGDLPRHRHRAAHRRARWGPPPEDEELRVTAARLAEHRWHVAVRQRPLVLAVAVVFGGLYARLAVEGSPRWWWGVVAALLLALAQVWWPRRLRRRVALLADGD